MKCRINNMKYNPETEKIDYTTDEEIKSRISYLYGEKQTWNDGIGFYEETIKNAIIAIEKHRRWIKECEEEILNLTREKDLIDLQIQEQKEKDDNYNN